MQVNMRMKQTFIILALLSYILIGCHEAKDTKSGTNVPTINLDSAYVSDFNYSELFQSARFILLDNTETLLANIDKMLLHKDTLLILDRKGQGVYATGLSSANTAATARRPANTSTVPTSPSIPKTRNCIFMTGTKGRF